MSVRKFFPERWNDRLFFIVYLAGFSVALFLSWLVGFPGIMLILLGFYTFTGVRLYIAMIKSPQEEAVVEEYTRVIHTLSGIETELGDLVTFLRLEREKVMESEAILNRLQQERSQLEPVVLAQRDTVNAVLSAYSKTTASRIWRERMVGFTLGLLASLLATVIFELLGR